MKEPVTIEQATIAIITALPKEMAAARLAFSDYVRDVVVGKSNSVYHLCSVPCIGGSVVVAMVQLAGMGNTISAAQTTQVLNDCENVKDVIMLGIAGAVPCTENAEKHVRMGDIVVSGNFGVYQYDYGKQESGKPFEVRSIAIPPSVALLRAVDHLLVDEELDKRRWNKLIDELSATNMKWKRPPTESDVLSENGVIVQHPFDDGRVQGYPRIFKGTIASSNTLLKDSDKRNSIVADCKASGVLCCVEMEGAGIANAAHLKGNTGYFIIRGTCDYCNPLKNNDWQRYAALIAAAFTRCVIERLGVASGSVSTDKVSPSLPLSYAETNIYRRERDQSNHIEINANIVNLTLITPGSACDISYDAQPQQMGSTDLLSAYSQSDGQKVLVTNLCTRLKKEIRQWNYSAVRECVSEIDNTLKDSILRTDLQRICLLKQAQALLFLYQRSRVNSCEDLLRAKNAVAMIEANEQNALSLDALLLKALIVFWENNEVAALSLLENINVPQSIKVRGSLLLGLNKIDDAVMLFDSHDYHEEWCDLAAYALTLSNRIDKADDILRWLALRDDNAKYMQCVVRISDALMRKALCSYTNGTNILPSYLKDDELSYLRSALDKLGPQLERIKQLGFPQSGIDEEILHISFKIHHLMQNRTDATQILRYFLCCIPVPLDAVRGVISGYAPATEDLPARIRNEHPDSVEAGVLACVVEADLLNKPSDAFVHAKSLHEAASGAAEKEQLIRLFQQLWGMLSEAEDNECEAYIEVLVAGDDKQNALFEADRLIRHGHPSEADQILEANQSDDDLYWLQLKANSLLRQSLIKDAYVFIRKAAGQTMNSILLQKARDIAVKIENYDEAIWCCERLLELDPASAVLHHGNLAHIYAFEVGNPEKAAIEFRALHELEPDNSLHAYNLAVSLAKLFRFEESLALYNDLCSKEDLSMQAIFGRAQILQNMGKPDRALSSLLPFRERYSDKPDFLLGLMHVAHAAGNDELADTVLLQLIAMRETGEVSADLFKPMPQDEFLDYYHNLLNESEQRTKICHSEMLKGRMPWIWADQIENRAVYVGWRIRTRSLTWIGDEAINRARHAVYSTNGFHPTALDGGERELLPLQCTATGEAVVADISALITLHELDLLDAAATYFGEVYVPIGYLSVMHDECQSLFAHQKSRQDVAAMISRLVASNQIHVYKEDRQEIAFVDEYPMGDGYCYKLIDLLSPVHADGLINDEKFERLSRMARHPSAVDSEHPALTRYQSVLIDISTLESIANQNILKAVVEYYRVHLTEYSVKHVQERLASVEWLNDTRLRHMNLWEAIQADGRYKFVPYDIPDGLECDGRTDRDYLPFMSAFIANQNNVPLLADDRACQAYAMNADGECKLKAFGTDALLRRLVDSGAITPKHGVAEMMLLMRWRYRFLLLPSDMLKVLADAHRSHPPGVDLLFVSDYVHDCMRDVGLFAGQENTKHGDNIAAKYYLGWLNAIAEFLVSVWADEEWTIEKSKTLTYWACEELLPSCPQTLDVVVRTRIAQLTPRLFLTRVLLATSTQPASPRMADAMKAFQEALRLSDTEYSQIFIGVLDDTLRTAPKS